MKKKLISILLCVALSISLLAGCSSSKKNSETPEESVSTEKSVVDVEEKETEATSEENTEEDKNEFGLTDSEMAVIYSDMEENLQTEYLEPNNISAEEFSIPDDDESWKAFAKGCDIMFMTNGVSIDQVQQAITKMYILPSEDT